MRKRTARQQPKPRRGRPDDHGHGRDLDAVHCHDRVLSGHDPGLDGHGPDLDAHARGALPGVETDRGVAEATAADGTAIVGVRVHRVVGDDLRPLDRRQGTVAIEDTATVAVDRVLGTGLDVNDELTDNHSYRSTWPGSQDLA